MKFVLIISVFLFPFFLSGQADTVRVFFDSDKDEGDFSALDEISRRNDVLSVKIYGYADQNAGDEYNFALSRRRAENVKKYLLNKNPSLIIIELRGAGEIKTIPVLPFHRRVDVILERKTPDEKTEPVRDTVLEKYIPPAKGKTTIEELEVNETLELEGLNFYGGQAIPKKNSLPVLEKLLKTLQDNPTVKIEIQGHVCCTGGPDGMDLATGLNNLSVARAKFVYQWLIEKGISPERLTYRGFGRMYPLTRERTEEEREQNRRVEIKLTEK